MRALRSILLAGLVLSGVGCESTRERRTAKSVYVVPPEQVEIQVMERAEPEMIVVEEKPGVIALSDQPSVIGVVEPPAAVVTVAESPAASVKVVDKPMGSVALAADAGLPLDARVLNDMHRINHAEIMAGKLGMEKGRTEAVRRYGEHLWRDHRAHDELVISTARDAGIELYQPRPTELERQALARLERLSGAEFDRAFTEEMRIGHERAVLVLERAQAALSNDDVRKLVGQTIPTLRSHERMAVDLSVD